ncbi:MAG: sensor histidine kinase [Oceanococcus sp.]
MSQTRSDISGIDPWRTLEAMSFYRAAVCVALLTLAVSNYRPPYFDSSYATHIDATLYVYLFMAALLLVMARGQRPALPWQVSAQIGIDILVVILLAFFSGGVGSGLGALLVTPVAAGSLLLSRRVSVVPPAIATIALLAIETYLALQIADNTQNYTQAGILGAGLFIIALTGGALARRARESETRALKAQHDLTKLAMLSENVIQKMQAGVLVVNAQGQIELLNRAARQLVGAGAAPGRHLSACAPTIWQRLNHWKKDPSALTNTALALSEDRTAWTQYTRLGAGSDASSLVVLDDASRVAEQAQSMKLASLGRLAASIAHEIRNPLAAIQHAAELTSESPHLHEDDAALVEIIKRQSNRLAAIVTSVLSLSRKNSDIPPLFKVRQLIQSALSEFESPDQKTGIKTDICVEPPSLAIAIESVQFNQILHNLLHNALLHAQPASHEVNVNIHARISTDGNLALLDISDNGVGISPAVARHIFEPFFSTRHEGTGLGLFITRELCTAAQGDLQLIQREDGEQGAYFRLSFPASLMGL